MNSNAGDGDVAEAHVLAAFRELGWTIDPIADEALNSETPEVLVVLGGDGTLARVIHRYHRWPTRLVVLPGGTANNVAHTLGAGDGDVLDEIARFAQTREIVGDLGLVRATGEPFLESFGVGAFSHLLRTPDIEDNKGVACARSLLADVIERQPAVATTLELDGRRVDGAFLLVEVMNTRSFGPAIELAPHARIDDALFDVCLVPESARSGLVEALRSRTAWEAPPIERHRARHVMLTTSERWAHADGVLRSISGRVELSVDAGAVHFLVPTAE